MYIRKTFWIKRMAKRVIFDASTPYQLLTNIIISKNYYSSDIKILLLHKSRFEDIENLHKRLVDSDLFDEVYIMKEVANYPVMLPILLDQIAQYDLCSADIFHFSSYSSVFSTKIYNSIKDSAKIYLTEEGLASYNLARSYQEYIDTFDGKIRADKIDLDRIDKIFVYNKELFMSDIDIPLEQINVDNIFDNREFIEKLNYIFDYKYKKIKEHNIFFTQNFLAYNVVSKEDIYNFFEKLSTILKDDLIINLHPFDSAVDIYKSLGIKILDGIKQVPWELILINHINNSTKDDKLNMISVSSTSLSCNELLLNGIKKDMKIESIYLYKLFDTPYNDRYAHNVYSITTRLGIEYKVVESFEELKDESISIDQIYKDSLLEQDFYKKIKDDTIKVVSFDIFDTLLFRECDKPRSVFDIVGDDERVKSYFDTKDAFREYRVSAEKKAIKNHKEIEDITLDMIYDELNIPTKLKEEIKALELKVEKEYLITNLQIDRWIDIAYKYNKKIILTSDMYLNENQIRDILKDKLSNYEKISKIYMSNEYKKRKSSGSLYISILKELNISSEEMLHIGDNEKSDILVANTLGIKTLYCGLDKNQKERKEYESIYLTKSLYKAQHIRVASILQNPYSNDLQKFYFNLSAYIYGPILWEFSHWIKSIADRFDLTQINFIMREGYIFKRYFDKLYPEFDSNLIYASRKSTLLTSMDSFDISELEGEQKKVFRVIDLYNALLIDIDDKYIKEYQDTNMIEAEKIDIDSTNLFDYIMEDLEKKSTLIESNIKDQKEYLSEYFKVLNIKKESALLDFGGGGTIFNKFKNILKDNIPTLNMLLFQDERGYKKQVNNHTLSFFPYTKECAKAIQRINATPELTEIILNLHLPTTSHYSKEDNKIVPITTLPECNSDILKDFSDAIIRGVDTFFEIANIYDIEPNSYDREELAMILSRVIKLPTNQEASMLGSLEHHEGKGSEYTYKIVTNSDISYTQDHSVEMMYHNYLKNQSQYIHKLRWIEGSISHIDDRYLSYLYKTSSNSNINENLVKQIINRVKKSGLREFYIYGAGEIFLFLYPYLEEIGIKIAGIIDTKAEIKEFRVLEYDVKSINSMLKDKNSANIIIASGAFAHKIEEKISLYAKENSKNIEIIRA
jgi:predicted HAD superfamily hydrolase